MVVVGETGIRRCTGTRGAAQVQDSRTGRRGKQVNSWKPHQQHVDRNEELQDDLVVHCCALVAVGQRERQVSGRLVVVLVEDGQAAREVLVGDLRVPGQGDARRCEARGRRERVWQCGALERWVSPGGIQGARRSGGARAACLLRDRELVKGNEVGRLDSLHHTTAYHALA